jgi:hypothetical protein
MCLKNRPHRFQKLFVSGPHGELYYILFPLIHAIPIMYYLVHLVYDPNDVSSYTRQYKAH